VAKRPKKQGSKQGWFTAEEQLARAKAKHGSKFEKFILANQDHRVLRPEEHSGDGIEYPLWLRVYWRKQHPEQPDSPAGPAGDYPEALDRIEEWMKANQDLGPHAARWLSAAQSKPRSRRHGD
jgi:hypothetical protein